LNPSRITQDEETGIVYARNAQVRTPEDIAASKSKLKWNDKNRPYQIANGNRSSATWRGGVLTQVRTAPAYKVLDTGKVQLIAPAPAPAPAKHIVERPKRDNRTAREKRYANRMARYTARNEKQIVNSSNTRVTPVGGNYRRNGTVIYPNNRIEQTGSNASVVQHTCTPKIASLENAVTLVNR